MQNGFIYTSSFTININQNGTRQEEWTIRGYMWGTFDGSAYLKRVIRKNVLYLKMINKWTLLLLFFNLQCTSIPEYPREAVKRTIEKNCTCAWLQTKFKVLKYFIYIGFSK